MRKGRSSTGLKIAAFAAALAAFAGTALAEQQSTPLPAPVKKPSTLRLYIFDCGVLHIADVGRFGLKPALISSFGVITTFCQRPRALSPAVADLVSRQVPKR